jgi:hypothetical protein
MLEFDFRYNWLADLSPDESKWIEKRAGLK